MLPQKSAQATPEADRQRSGGRNAGARRAARLAHSRRSIDKRTAMSTPVWNTFLTARDK
jgi:hypothetical protein